MGIPNELFFFKKTLNKSCLLIFCKISEAEANVPLNYLTSREQESYPIVCRLFQSAFVTHYDNKYILLLMNQTPMIIGYLEKFKNVSC